MKLEQQVVSLELAKKLKELGVKQESVFVWRKLPTRPEPEVDTNFGLDSIGERGMLCSAFTVAELGEMLPKTVVDEKGKRHPKNYRGANAYGQHIVSYHEDFSPPLETVFADTEADARAKMLIYLIENKLITV